jgi:hypothetical protein
MPTVTARVCATILPLLLLAACGDPQPANISEDQLNHFSGITAHDHDVPAALTANATDEAVQTDNLTNPARPRR